MAKPRSFPCRPGIGEAKDGQERRKTSDMLSKYLQGLCLGMERLEEPNDDKGDGGPLWTAINNIAEKPSRRLGRSRQILNISPLELALTPSENSSEESENSFELDTPEEYSESVSSAEMAFGDDPIRDSYHGPLNGNLETESLVNSDTFRVVSLQFSVPLDYRSPYGERITLHADLVYSFAGGGRDLHRKEVSWREIFLERKSLVYLCGGPGDGNPWNRIPKFNELMLRKGYSILYPHYRGTGKSTPITADSLRKRFGQQPPNRDQLLYYFAQFRQDNIVRDLEAIRKTLETVLSYDQKIKFTLHGQSYGGWVALTYLSYLAETSLEEVYLTAGLAPITKTPDEVYKALYDKVATANETYYEMYPKDEHLVKQIYLFLRERGVDHKLPDASGRVLNAQTFLTLGRKFISGSSGFNDVHNFVQALSSHLEMQSKTLPAGHTVQDYSIPDNLLQQFADIEGFKFHSRPLYGILHEAIYVTGPGIASNWSANRVGKGRKGFDWLNDDKAVKVDINKTKRLYFSGEMVHPFMLTTLDLYLRAAAQVVSEKNDWPPLYDRNALKKNKCPVKAMVYPEDLSVDHDASLAALGEIGAGECFMGNDDWEHGSLRTRTVDVVNLLYGRGLDWQEPVFGG